VFLPAFYHPLDEIQSGILTIASWPNLLLFQSFHTAPVCTIGVLFIQRLVFNTTSITFWAAASKRPRQCHLFNDSSYAPCLLAFPSVSSNVTGIETGAFSADIVPSQDLFTSEKVLESCDYLSSGKLSLGKQPLEPLFDECLHVHPRPVTQGVFQ
jgi:hypothetical protein